MAKAKRHKSKSNKFVSENSQEDDSEHELSYYMNDRIKMMKEVLKIIKPKKIKSMAPNCIKDLDVEEINSMLLEELLGISNKRLRHILNGENVDEESSSTDPEEEKQPIDIISLDDITDSEDDFNFGGNTTNNTAAKSVKSKKSIKKEKIDKTGEHKMKKQNKPDNLTENEKVMSVLELLELQARARAIRSQLAIESAKKDENKVEQEIKDEDSDPDAIILESTEPDEIVIDSSESDNEKSKSDSQKTNGKQNSATNMVQEVKKSKKIKIIRDYRIAEAHQDISKKTDETTESNKTVSDSNENSAAKEKSVFDENKSAVVVTNEKLKNDKSDNEKPEEKDLKQIDKASAKKIAHEKSDSETDEIVVINVDQEEMDGIVNV